MPPAVEFVNPVPVDEVPAYARALATTFLGDPESPGSARRQELMRRAWDPERTWGARDRDRWVATLRTEPRQLAVPGIGSATSDLTVDALTSVTVAATHRRLGLMTRLLTDSLRAAREREEPLSILIAAEWPIYGRFGYAPAIPSADYSLRRTRAGARCAGDPTRMHQVDRDEVGALVPSLYEAARRQRVGQLDRSEQWWDRVLGRDGYEPSDELPHNWLVHEGDDGPDGLLGWKAVGDFGLVPPWGGVKVWELVSTTDAAYRDIWAYLCGIDLTEEVTLSNRPVDEPVRWLLNDGRTLVTTRLVDLVWLRLLDVEAALVGRRYACPGEVVLEVIDEDGERFAAGRYLLRADRDRVECERTERPADLEISQRALASIYLGGYRLRELAPAGLVTELTPGALATVEVMFSTPLAPWNGTWF